MKRIIASILIFMISLTLIVPLAVASNEVFIAINDLMLPLTDAMPIKSGGVWYIDYQSFSRGNLKVNSAYSEEKKTLTLYTWDITLVFDMNNVTAYTTEEMIAYKQWCFYSNGTFYVPAQFAAKKLGFEYSYLDDIQLIRIKNTSNIPDNVYYYIAKSNRQNLLDAYYGAKIKPSDPNTATDTPNKSTKPASAETSSSVPDSNVPVTSKRIVCLTFTITNGQYNDKILDLLTQYGVKATFFLQGDTLQKNDNSIRRMVATGHKIGLAAYSGDADYRADAETMLNRLNEANDLLYQIACVKTRMIRVPSGSAAVLSDINADALVNNGFRLWDWNVNAYTGKASPSSSRIYNAAIQGIEKRGASVVVLRDDAATVSALSRILKHLSEAEMIVRGVGVLDTPVNQRGDTR